MEEPVASREELEQFRETVRQLTDGTERLERSLEETSNQTACLTNADAIFAW